MTYLPTTASPTILPETVGVTRSGKLHLINRASVGTEGPLRAACNRLIVVDRLKMEDPLLSNLQRRTIRHLLAALRHQANNDRLILSSRNVCANCDTAVRRELSCA